MKLFLYILNFFLIVILGIRAVLLSIYSNTINASFLAFGSIFLGVLLGYWIAKINDDIDENDTEEEFEKYKLYATCIVSSMITCFVLAFNVNYALPIFEKRVEKLEIIEVQPYFGSRGGILKGEVIVPTGYHIWVMKNGKKERFRTEYFEKFEEMDKSEVNFIFRKGILGFDCFLGIKS